MAMTDEEAEKLKGELAQTKQQLTDILKAQQTEKTNATEAEKKRAATNPGKLELDPDVVKEVASLKGRIDELEKTLGKSKDGKGTGFLNFFGEK